jgi:hypothetical protein
MHKLAMGANQHCCAVGWVKPGVTHLNPVLIPFEGGLRVAPPTLQVLLFYNSLNLHPETDLTTWQKDQNMRSFSQKNLHGGKFPSKTE